MPIENVFDQTENNLMSGVKSPEFQHYQNAISDYQRKLNQASDERETEIERQGELHEEDLQNQRAKHERSYATVRSDAQETINESLRAAKNEVQNERKRAQEEVDEFKRQVYNRQGLAGSADNQILREQLETQQELFEKSSNDNSARLSDQEENFNKRIEDLHEENAHELEKVADASRRSSLEAYKKRFREDKQDYLGFKGELENKYQLLSEKHAEDLVKTKKEAQRAIESVKRDYNNRLRNDRNQSNRSIARLEKKVVDDVSDTADRYTSQNREETKVLRDQIKSLIATQDDFVKGRAEGRTEVIKDFENENRVQNQLIQEAAERQLAKEASANAARTKQLAENYYAGINSRGDTFAKVQKERETAYSSQRAEIEEQFQKNLEDRDKRINQIEEYNELKMNAASERSQTRMEKALMDQAEAYQQSMRDQNSSKDFEIQRLESELEEVTTSKDISNISPAVEEKLREQIEGEYKEDFAAERTRSRETIDSIQDDYSQRTQDVIRDSGNQLKKLTQEMTQQQNLDRGTFVSYVHETDFSTKIKMEDLEKSHQKQMNNLQGSLRKEMESQRRRYEDLIQDIRLSASNELNTVKADNSFQEKMAARVSNAKMAEMSRMHDRVLSEKREDFELELQSNTEDFKKQIREMERTQKQELEAQKKGFDHRLAQISLQSEERERFIRENYEDTIAKIRRTNERLIRAKG